MAEIINGYRYLVTFGGIGVDTSPLTITTTGTVVGGVSYDAVYAYSTYRNPVVVNQGTVKSTNFAGINFKAGGSVNNTGFIQGATAGIYITGSAGQVTNSGTITGTGAGAGVRLAAGGTVVNTGKIAGAGGTAISFGGNGANRLVLDPGYTLVGKAVGSTTAGATNTLELGSAANAGTVSGIGTNITNFGTVTLDAGARWTLAGSNTLASGVTLTDLGTLTNTGALTGTGKLVVDPATLINSGSIGLTVTLAGGGNLDNVAMGRIAVATGNAVYGTGSPATIANAGTITDASGEGVVLSAGGGVTNTGTGLIEGPFDGVQVSAAAGTVTNFGTILGVGLAGVGHGVDLLAGGSVANNAGVIEGYVVGASMEGFGALSNAGTILGTLSGVELFAGGSVHNTTGGLIEAELHAVSFYNSAGTVSNYGTILATLTSGGGVQLFAGGTVIDAGTITGGNGTAVFFGGTGGNRLVLDPGYHLGGVVVGGTGAGATNALELGSAASAGTVTAALASEFVHFGTVTVDPGAQWVLSANNTIAGGVALSIAGTLTDIGTLTNAGRIGGTGKLLVDPATLINSGSIGLTVSLTGGGYLDNQATGQISGATGSAGANGGGPGGSGGAGVGGAGTIGNAGMIAGGLGGTGGYSPGGTGGPAGAGGIGVGLSGGGSLGNSGTIIGGRGGAGGVGSVGGAGGAGGVGVSLSSGGTIGNVGTIAGGQGGYGYQLAANGATGAGIVLAAGGNLTNGSQGASGALISGGIGVAAYGTASASVTNYGTITGTTGFGVSLASGGTVVDSGTIGGSTGAVSFGGTGGNLLGLESGYALSGAVIGGASAANTVELLGGAGAVTADYNGLALSNFGAIAFGAASGNSETWTITNDATLPGTIAGFIAVHDTVDLTGFLGGTVLNSGTVNGSDQLVVGNGSGTVTLQLDASEDYSGLTWQASFDGGAGTDVTPVCYCRGTLILTDRGEVAIEELAIGDMVVTLSGAARPVKWIGQRAYDSRFIVGNRDVLPIRVAAGALAEGVPARDLYLSPDHALCIDGVLVTARQLLNGATITQETAVEELEYFHIELDTHDILFANGAPAESYADCDNRGRFHNAAEFAALYPDDDRPRWQFCAALLQWESEEPNAIRAALLQRAEALGHKLDRDPDLHLVVDGAVIRPLSIEGRVYRFTIPGGAAAASLASRSAVPAEISATARDLRRLGVAVERLVVHDGDLRIEAAHGHAGLTDGFQEDEPGHRWTDGLARLPDAWLRAFPGGAVLEVHLVSAELCYRVPPPVAERAAA